jgi:hypothetical protein
MEQTLKIQEELEQLMDQLEKLRKINDITTLNTTAAEQVINQVREFIVSYCALEKLIVEDTNAKSRNIEELISKLNESLLKLDEKSSEISSEIQKEFQSLRDAVSGTIFESFKEAGFKIEEIKSRLSVLDAEFGKLTTNFESINFPERISTINTSISALQTNTQSLQNSLNELYRGVAQHAEKQREYHGRLVKRIKSINLTLLIALGIVVAGLTILLLKSFSVF